MNFYPMAYNVSSVDQKKNNVQITRVFLVSSVQNLGVFKDDYTTPSNLRFHAERIIFLIFRG